MTVLESTRLTLSLYRKLSIQALIDIERYNGATTDDIIRSIDLLVLSGDAEVFDEIICHKVKKPEKISEKYKNSQRFSFSNLFWRVVGILCGKKFAPMVAFLVTIFGFCIGLCAADVPQGIISGIAAVETGTNWDGQTIKGKWTKGKAGEVSPFQLMPSTLKDLGCKNINEVHKSPVIAAYYCEKYLVELFERHGNWPEAIARYNAGSRYRSATARDYAQRVLNLAQSF
jgi:hypothetical protein